MKMQQTVLVFGRCYMWLALSVTRDNEMNVKSAVNPVRCRVPITICYTTITPDNRDQNIKVKSAHNCQKTSFLLTIRVLVSPQGIKPITLSASSDVQMAITVVHFIFCYMFASYVHK